MYTPSAIDPTKHVIISQTDANFVRNTIGLNVLNSYMVNIKCPLTAI